MPHFKLWFTQDDHGVFHRKMALREGVAPGWGVMQSLMLAAPSNHKVIDVVVEDVEDVDEAWDAVARSYPGVWPGYCPEG